MPRGDGTGPAGMGPMTGRAAGYCAGYDTPGFANPVGGQGRGAWGRGRGFGGGRGRRNWFYATGMPGWARTTAGMPAWGAAPYPPPGPTAAQETEALRQRAAYLETTLDEVRTRIEELKRTADD